METGDDQQPSGAAGELSGASVEVADDAVADQNKNSPPDLPSTSLSTSETADIGLLLDSGIDPHGVSNTQKLQIILSKVDSKLKYPTTYMNGCNRRFQAKWADTYPWLHYSKSENGAFCKACALFAPEKVSSQKLGVLVTTPFNNWTSMSTVFQRHDKSKYHQDSMVKMDAFKNTTADSSTSIGSRLCKERDERIKMNTEIIRSLLECVIFLGKQGLSYRGHRDDCTNEDVVNSGNFIELVQFRAQTDTILANHLKNAPRNATYLSKTIQNELIQVVGNSIRKKIINDIKAAQFFSILADEVTDCSNQEQLSLAIRFVDSGDCEIREEFLDFITVERITGEALASAILLCLREWGIPIENCRGQGYDGASNMSSSVCGVQGRIREQAPLAFYTHCQAHQLNLCIMKACSVPDIRNANGVVSEIVKFFTYSPKRQHFFESNISSDSDKKKLKDLCKTRWIERIDTYATFFDLFPSIIITLEAISTGRDSNWNWDAESRLKASGFLHQITSFQFLVAASITMRILSLLRGITVKLQRSYSDILKAHELVSEVHSNLHIFKINCEIEFHAWYSEIVTLAESQNITVSTPRIAQRQAHRANVPAETPEIYYRRNVMLPFLDHILSEMDTRFNELHKKIVKLLVLVPSVLAQSESIDPIQDIAEVYSTDLPMPSSLSVEWQRWKQKWRLVPECDRPDTLRKALVECDKDCYPNIKVLLSVACTLPVTVCENERANSQLKLLKTYLRTTMTEERLSALAIIKIHQTIAKQLDRDLLVQTFANTHPRRMLMSNIFQ